MIWIKRTDIQAFTLLEVMISLSLIAVTLVSLISVLISSSVLNQQARESNLAANAARAKLEEWQVKVFTKAAFDSEIKNKLTTVGTEKVYTEDFDVPGLNLSAKDSMGSSSKAGYLKIISITPDDNLVDVQIIIEWRSQNGQHQKSELWGRLAYHPGV